MVIAMGLRAKAASQARGKANGCGRALTMPAAPQGPGGSSGSLILTTGSTVAESLALDVPGAWLRHTRDFLV
jgi:hypothetical protein